ATGLKARVVPGARIESPRQLTGGFHRLDLSCRQPPLLRTLNPDGYLLVDGRIDPPARRQRIRELAPWQAEAQPLAGGLERQISVAIDGIRIEVHRLDSADERALGDHPGRSEPVHFDPD